MRGARRAVVVPLGTVLLGTVLLGTILLGTGACGSNSTTTGGTLTVFAAASLKAPFEALAEDFERKHSGTSVQLNFAGSSDLATQLISGAPADVFASANEATMDSVASEGLLAATPETFATNTLTIAVPNGNPSGIDSLEDLADPQHAVVLCAPQVPCGAATEEVQRVAGIDIPAVSEEGSVTDVLGKVSSGQADAGLVYVTDVAAAAGSIDRIDFEAAAQAVNTYPIAATITGSPLAEDFISLVTGPVGQEILSTAGFGTPDP